MVDLVRGNGFLFCVAGSFYVLHATIHYMDADLATSFAQAVKQGWRDLRVLLRFVPVVGRLFEPDEDKTHYDPDEG